MLGVGKTTPLFKKDKMKISLIKLNKKNPRLIKDYKFEKLKKSITEFPKMLELRPIIIDNDNIILGGNMRYQALKDLGYKELPDNWVKKSSELSEEEKQRFIMVDNISYGDFDWDIIANEWDTEILADWGLDGAMEINQIENFETPNDVINRDITDILEVRIVVAKSIKDIEKLNDLLTFEKQTIDEDIRLKLSREKNVYVIE